MEKEIVEREIRVVTDQEILKNAKPESGHPIRKWKVTLFAIDDIGEKYPLNFVEKVEYHLHPTFEPQTRVIRKPPFTLTEKGWGEFDMQIVLYFTDKSVDSMVLDHDLNFRKNHYEIPHILAFDDPKPPFKKLLTPDLPTEITKPKIGRPKRLRSSAGTSKRRKPDDNDRRDDEDIPKTNEIHSPLSEDTTLIGDSLLSSALESPVSTPKSSEDNSVKSSSKSSPESTRSLSSNNDKENDYKVDYQKLANNLYALKDDDILDLIDIVNTHRTPNMYINDETEGEFHIDLYTLGDGLARELWKFTVSRLENYSPTHSPTS